MKKAVTAALAALLAGCSGRDTAPAAQAKSEAPAEAKMKPGEVVVSESSQRVGGIVVATLQLQNIGETIGVTGELTVNEDRTWTVGSHIEGRLVSVYAKPGDYVRAGFVLARMHSHQVHDARADYRRASDDLTRARAAVVQSARMRERTARLLELKAASKQDLEVADAHLRDAELAVRHAQTEAERIRTHITEYLNVTVEDERGSTNEDYVPLKAPASGVVLERKANEGSVVTPGQEVFRISDISNLWMMASASETDLGQLRVGQTVRINVRAYPERAFTGRILRLGEQLDATTRTLKVRVLVPNPGGLLKPEMYAAAEIERTASRPALFIPESAVQELNGSSVVFVRSAPDRFEARPIQTARASGGRLEVTAGLRAGERIAIKGGFVLKSQMLRSSMQEE